MISTSSYAQEKVDPSLRQTGLFTDINLATREVALQRWLLARHAKSAVKWGELASKAPATADLKSLCFKRVPIIALEYFLGGAGDQISLKRNREAFTDVYINPNCAVRFNSVDMSTTVLGRKISMPIIAAPVGSQRSLWPEGEAVVAEAASNAGIPYCLSTLTGTAMERVREVAKGPCWFQLYLVGGKEVALRGLARAKEAGYEALVLTIDTAVAGNRLGQKRDKSSQLIEEMVKSIQSNEGFVSKFFKGYYNERMKQLLTKDFWTHLSYNVSFLADGQLMDFPNIHLEPGKPMQYRPIAGQLKQSAVTWDDIAWIRKAWGDGPMIIKGVHNVQDARLAEKHGAAAIVISNHGGRQADNTPATLHLLQEIAPRLHDDGSKMEIYLDGGVMTGQDVIVAKACGANAVGVGRAAAYGLGAGGPKGVARVFEIFKSEIEESIRLLGRGNGSIDDIGPDIFYKFLSRIT